MNIGLSYQMTFNTQINSHTQMMINNIFPSSVCLFVIVFLPFIRDVKCDAIIWNELSDFFLSHIMCCFCINLNFQFLRIPIHPAPNRFLIAILCVLYLYDALLRISLHINLCILISRRSTYNTNCFYIPNHTPINKFVFFFFWFFCIYNRFNVLFSVFFFVIFPLLIKY